jgi:hypothetical protein
MPAALEFQKSINQELEIVRKRVRHLIGTIHWGEDGRYHEAVLKNVIRRFLPSHISIGTGFIVRNGGNNGSSKQIDIILYDNTRPLLFSEGDFIITTPANVRGVIEVKSKLRSSTLHEVIDDFDKAIGHIFAPEDIVRRRVKEDGSGLEIVNHIFMGLFCFEYEGSEGGLKKDIFLESHQYLNHLALGPSLFIRKWPQEDGERLVPRVQTKHDFYNTYQITDLAFSYFISNLIDIVSDGLSDRYWFSFPIARTKEVNRCRTFTLTNKKPIQPRPL